MLSLSVEAIRNRAEAMIADIKNAALNLELLPGDSAVGGGAAPTISLRTTLISLSHVTQTAAEIEHRLRRSNPPIIARIAEDKVLIDLRTVFEDEEPQLRQALASL
jgi:L-seryl-tRNA(Ser) seleniumtransferase